MEQVKMIENITIQYAEDLFWHPPQGFGNARDLDIGEGMVFGKDTVEDEEEIEWYEPKCNPPHPSDSDITLDSNTPCSFGLAVSVPYSLGTAPLVRYFFLYA